MLAQPINPFSEATISCRPKIKINTTERISNNIEVGTLKKAAYRKMLRATQQIKKYCTMISSGCFNSGSSNFDKRPVHNTWFALCCRQSTERWFRDVTKELPANLLLKTKNLLIVSLFITALPVFGQTNEITFQVSYRKKIIGFVKAVEETSGGSSRKQLKTTTHTKLLIITVHIESEIDVRYQNGSLTHGVAYRKANRGCENISSEITTIADKKYQVVRNEKLTILKGELIDYCVVDLYFREPKNIKHVFSNMYGQFIKIKWIGPSKYKVTAPDNNISIYTYKNGKLTTIDVETQMGKVIIARK